MLDGPLSLASFGFYRSVRFVMRRLVVLNSRFNRRRARQWYALSAESLKLPLALPAIMTSGPRWNPHAIIAGAGPIEVKQSIGIDVETLQASAKSWTFVVYTFPDQRTAAHTGTLQAAFDGRWHFLTLPPGMYSVTLRLYDWSDAITLPEVQADGAAVIPAKPVSAANNDFYDDLWKRRGRLYLWLHYYVYALLRGSVSIPGASREHEFLPMGNPETEFRYGAVEEGESVRLDIPASILTTHDVYFTLYTRDSFPARWYRIHESPHVTGAVEEDGFYLVRIHQRSLTNQGSVAASVRVETLCAPKRMP